MDGLHGVADVVEEAVEGFKGPAGAAERLPDGGVVGEGSEGDEGVVGRAAAEDFGARVTDMRVSCMSHGSVNGVIRVLIPFFLEALQETESVSFTTMALGLNSSATHAWTGCRSLHVESMPPTHHSVAR